MIEDFERCYRFMQSRDPRYDGFFVVAVTSTGVYCRPSCPARLPSRRNVRLFRSSAAAQEEGFRACKRCDPDAAPGSPAWNRRADVAGRAVRLIADGAVDREGVGGLASRLHFSERQLNRILVCELGAGPVALARAQRAQTARTLIQTTDLPFAQVALGAGFRSVRQFNDTVRAVYARTPTELPQARAGRGGPASGAIELRLPYREPFDGDSLVAFLAARAIPGVEEVDGSTYRRTLVARARCRDRGPHSSGALRPLRAASRRPARPHRRGRRARAVCSISTPTRSRSPPSSSRTARSRRWCANAPACACRAAWTGSSSGCGRSSASRSPWPAARTVLGRLAARHGEPVAEPDGASPTASRARRALAELDPAALPFPRTRARALRSLARLGADGELPSTPAATRPRRSSVLGDSRRGRWTTS